jgi:hypothetical protein
MTGFAADSKPAPRADLPPTDADQPSLRTLLSRLEDEFRRQLDGSSEVRSNLFLPSAGSDGYTTAWSTDRPDLVDGDGRIHRPAPGHAPETVRLTARLEGPAGAEQRTLHLTLPALPQPDEPFGYLMVHFVQSEEEGGEQIHFSLTEGDDPLRWYRLNDGQPVLWSQHGTGGVRDPYIVRSPERDRFRILATDLQTRVSGWDHTTTNASRHMEVWSSDDLVTWGPQHHVRVIDDHAGMVWAPEAIYDTRTGEYLLHWTSTLYPEGDDHSGDQDMKILCARTRDFLHFSPPEVWMEAAGHAALSGSMLDSTVTFHDGYYYRFVKGVVDDCFDETGQPLGDIFIDRATTLDAPMSQWERLASGITYRATGHHPYEGPLVFRTHQGDRWFMFADHYGDDFHGYVPFVTTDIASREWARVDDSAAHFPASTKHGCVLPLTRSEWLRLRDHRW